MAKQQEAKHCLLIMQRKFHGYQKFLKDELIARGYAVDVANDEYPAGIMGKIMGKVQFPLIFSTTYNAITKRYLNNNTYDIAIIIKGRGFSQRLIKKMQETIPEVVGYNWDTFKNNRSPLKWYKSLKKYYTFDYADADEHSIPCIELFSSLPVSASPKNIQYDVSALGKNYVHRLKYIDRVLTVLKPEKSFIFLYENNIFDLILNFIKNPALCIKHWKHIHFYPMKYNDYIDVVKSSEVTIDFANSQTGITMRCYESLSLKTKIISNNVYLSRSAYFNESNYIVMPVLASPENMIAGFNKLKEAEFVLKSRDITDFMDDLLA